tara:strand:- start:960 stop:1157 length:198 start_codon:yes stop_codon:yes gene_type:complete
MRGFYNMAKKFQIELTKPEVEEIHTIVDTEIFEYMIEQDQDDHILVSIRDKMAKALDDYQNEGLE